MEICEIVICIIAIATVILLVKEINELDKELKKIENLNKKRWFYNERKNRERVIRKSFKLDFRINDKMGTGWTLWCHDIILYGILKILGYDDIPLEFNPRWYSKQEIDSKMQEIDSAIKNVLEKGEI